MKRQVIIVLMAGFAFFVHGCANKKKTEEKKIEEVPRALPADIVGLDAIPSNAEVVLSLDIDALKTVAILQRSIERMFVRDPDLEKQIDAAFRICKFDLMTDLRHATLALIPSQKKEGTDSLLVATGRFQENQLVSCLGRYIGDQGGSLETIAFEGRTFYHQVIPQEPGIWFSFGSKDTFLAASAREALQKSLGKGPKLKGNLSTMAPLISRIDPDMPIWGVGNLNPKVAAGLVEATGGAVDLAESIVISAAFKKGFQLRVGVAMKSEKDATILISQASLMVKGLSLSVQKGSVELGPLLNKLVFLAEKNWATLKWNLTKQELANLMKANMAGMGLAIDNKATNEQNPAPESDTESKKENGKRHTSTNNEKDL